MTSKITSNAASSPACSPRIPIVPVRYAVLPGEPGAKPCAYVASGFDLDQGLPALKEAAYTLRALRPGYVYVYMKGPGGEKLVIHEYDGEGKYRELTYTGLENYHRRNAYRDGGSSHWVWADTTSTEVWIGYSTHLWTNAVTTKVTGVDPAWRKRLMQPLNMKELTSGEKEPSMQKHVLPASALSTWVEDYKPKAQRVPLGWSACFSKDELPLGSILAQAGNYPATQPRVPAVVALYDAEGLTFELGLTVAARQHQALDLKNTLLASKDPNPSSALPACMRLDVEKVQPASADFHRKNVVAFLMEQSLRGMYKGDGVPSSRHPDTRAQVLRQQYQAQPGRQAPSDSELMYGVLTDKNMSPDGARFAKRVDYARYKAFLAERDEADQQLRQLLDRLAAACANQDVWLGTAEIANVNKPWSLAAALSSYDRDHKVSSQGLEQTIALCLHNMGNCLLLDDDKDPRYKRLEAWVDDKGSPVYMGLAAYNPFNLAVQELKQKHDLQGTLLGASAAAINELGSKFEAIEGATDLIVQTTHTVFMSRLKGQTRWDKNHRLRQNVEAAAKEARMEDLIGLVGARYRITDELPAAEAQFTGEVQKLIDTGMAEVVQREKVTQVTTGSRKVTLEETRTLSVRPTLGGWTKTGAVSGLNFGMVYLNVINLLSAIKDLKEHQTGENVTNFMSALSGTVGALGASMVSGRAVYVAAILARGSNLPGLGFSTATARLLGSTAFTRVFGYAAIGFGLWTDIKKADRLKATGNEDASRYTYRGGIATAIGSALFMEGILTLSGAAFSIPIAGWGLAALILAGGLLIGAGVYLYGLADAENNRPLEAWITCSIFGNRMGDDSSKNEPDHRPKAYNGLEEELPGWYQAYYSPVLLDANAARQLGWEGVDSTWSNPLFDVSSVELCVLLPGYVMGHSHWDGQLTVPPRPAEVLPLDKNRAPPEMRITSYGLLLHYRWTLRVGNKVKLDLTYQPNQGLDEKAQVSASFVLGS